MAWFGQPVLIDELLFRTKHGIVDQSLHARMGAEPTNGDGFGLGWYAAEPEPAVFRSVAPAWSDANLRELARHVTSHAFLVHVRAAIGSPVQQTNCHPFRHGRWLFAHNGYVADFPQLRRDLMLALDDERFAEVHGSTDSEVLLQLALGFGLEDDPVEALARTVGLVEETARRRGCTCHVQASFGVTDGTALCAVRYATDGAPRSLFASAEVESIKLLHPDDRRLGRLLPGDRLIVSEPFSDLPGIWHEIPPNSAVALVHGGELEHRPFAPIAPRPAAA